jgi:hypothetical protein
MERKVKKFIIEVEEGKTRCDKTCPLKENGECSDIDGNMDSLIPFVDCNKYNLATMKIKEYNEPNCYNLQCKARIPEFKIELEDKIELEEEK